MKDKLFTVVGMGPGVSYSTAKFFAEKGFKIAMIAETSKNFLITKRILNLVGRKLSDTLLMPETKIH